MSTEIKTGDTFLYLGDHPESNRQLADERRVMQTAEDRPDTSSIPPAADPTADHLDPALAARRAEVEAKHQRLGDWLDQEGYDAVLLSRADSIAWLTAGGDLRENLESPEASVHLFVNKQSRAVLSDNVQSPRVFEEEIAGLGFHLKERTWHESSIGMIAGLCNHKKVATDGEASKIPDLRLADELDALRSLRSELCPEERKRLRVLGRTLTLSVEATCRNFEPGETEADLAGQLAHRLLREGITPVELRIAGDNRLQRYRQPRFKSTPIQRQVLIAATGRRQGLCASVSRIVSVGPADPQFQADHAIASMVDATLIYFSRPGQTIAEVFRRARRIYEKYGHPHEWELDYQGAITGYSPIEFSMLPESERLLNANVAIRWNPSVQASRSEDTIVVDHRGFEVVTEAQRWPKIDVAVKGYSITRPGILER